MDKQVVTLTDDDKSRYHRQMLLRDWGEAGQVKVKSASVFIAGAGGLGSPVACYLAVAGVGEIRICDEDRVELSNLNRQILHTEARIGEPKAVSAGKGTGYIPATAGNSLPQMHLPRTACP